MTVRPLPIVVVTAVLLAACGSDGEESPSPGVTATALDDGGTAGPGSSPSPSTSPTTDAQTDATSTDTPTSAPDPTTPPVSQPNPNPAGVDPEPIPAGRYAYTTNGWSKLAGGSQQNLPSTTWLVAAAPSGSRQNVTRDMRDGDGFGQTVRRLMEYGDDGFLLHEIETNARVQTLLGPVSDTRKLTTSPPGSLGAPDSEVGWTNTFTMSGDGVTAKITAKLVRFEDVTVGGQTLRAAVVTQDVTFTGEIEGTSTATTWLRPEDLLALKETSSTTVTSSGITQESQYSATLKSLTPS